MPLPKDLDFLGDADLDAETRTALLQARLEERRSEREAAEKEAERALERERLANDAHEKEQARTFERERLAKDAQEKEQARTLEQKRFWHNTPLMLALVGTISVLANGIVAYVQSSHTTVQTVTLKEFEAKLKESEKRSDDSREQQLTLLKQQIAQASSDADAKRTASKEEREFAFKIIEKELSKAGDTTSRATVLLFLVRAGVLNSLNRAELEGMAEADIRNAGEDPSKIGIPPTLGRPTPLRTENPDKVSFSQVIHVESNMSAEPPLAEAIVTYSSCEQVVVKMDVATFISSYADRLKLVKFGAPSKRLSNTFWVRPDAVDRDSVKPSPDGWAGKSVIGISCGGRSWATSAVEETLEEIREMLWARR